MKKKFEINLDSEEKPLLVFEFASNFFLFICMSAFYYVIL